MTLVRSNACKTWHKRVASLLLRVPAPSQHQPWSRGLLYPVERWSTTRKLGDAADVWIFSLIRLDCRPPTSLNVPAGV